MLATGGGRAEAAAGDRRRRRASISLLTGKGRKGGGRSDADTSGVIGVGMATAERVLKQCVLEGLGATLERKVHLNRRKRTLDAEAEATLAALACPDPLDGRARRTPLPARPGKTAACTFEYECNGTARLIGRRHVEAADRFEVGHTQKHGSWPDMAEIEIDVPGRQCLARRIPDQETMLAQSGAWEKERNEASTPVDCRFRMKQAPCKLKSLNPSMQ